MGGGSTQEIVSAAKAAKIFYIVVVAVRMTYSKSAPRNVPRLRDYGSQKLSKCCPEILKKIHSVQMS
jgi:hypothetical protein